MAASMLFWKMFFSCKVGVQFVPIMTQIGLARPRRGYKTVHITPTGYKSEVVDGRVWVALWYFNNVPVNGNPFLGSTTLIRNTFSPCLQGSVVYLVFVYFSYGLITAYTFCKSNVATQCTRAEILMHLHSRASRVNEVDKHQNSG